MVAAAKQAGGDTDVILESGEARHEDVMALLDLLLGAGIHNVTFEGGMPPLMPRD